jgi:YfiH family protein
VKTIAPDWSAPPGVHGFVTTRELGDMASAEGRAALRPLLPSEPAWLKQVHGTTVFDGRIREADAAVTREPGVVCAVMVADCMPVLLADAEGKAVGVAHAGWRGLCEGVIEATVRAMACERVVAWLGPAIGPRAYEVGEEVRERFLRKDQAAASAFAPTRPGHYLLDLYAVARQRLASVGVREVHGGGFCTLSDQQRFFSFRRDGSSGRMAGLLWRVE